MKKCIVLRQLHVLHIYSIKILLVVPYMYVTNLYVLLICCVSHFFHHTHAHYNNNYSVAIVPHRGVGTVLYCSPILYWIVPREMCYISLSNESL